MFEIFQLMLKTPVIMMTTGIELMTRTTQEIQSLINTGGSTPSLERKPRAAREPVPLPFPVSQPPPIPANVNLPPEEIEETSTEQTSKEDNKMSFSDDNVTTVQYQVLFVKRDYESILQDSQTVVVSNMNGDGFVAWQIANFIQDLPIEISQQTFDNLRTLPGAVVIRAPHDDHKHDRYKDGHYYLVKLSSDDNQYLRIEYQILSEVAREDANYDEDQTKALEQIARELAKPCKD